MLTPVFAMDIVRNERAGCVIVIPDQTFPVLRCAVEEFQYHVKESTGVSLDVVSESQFSNKGSAIFLGATKAALAQGIDASKLAPNAFVIKTIRENLYMAGRDSDGPLQSVGEANGPIVWSGTLFAVYEFLDKQMNVRWLWPGKLGEVIPKRKDLIVQEMNVSQSPKLIHSRIHVHSVESFVPGYRTKGWASEKIREDFYRDQIVWLRRHRISRTVDMDLWHYFCQYGEKYLKTHPEYFNLLPDGTRRPDPMCWSGRPDLVSMCVSEPSLLKQMIKDWQETRTPTRPFMMASENDTNGRCTCPGCMAWDVPDSSLTIPWDQRLKYAKKAFEEGKPEWSTYLGSLSDRYSKFLLAAQHEAEKVDPQATLMAFAYANYNKPPIETKLNDRIIMFIVPPIMYPWTQSKRTAAQEQWDGWNATGAKMVFRPNYMLDGHDMPIFIARKLGEDFTYAYKHGMIGTDISALTGQYGVQGPAAYLLARIHENPEWSVDKILEEYYDGFGPARKQVQAYFKFWETVDAGVTDEFYNKDVVSQMPEGGVWVNFYQVANAIFTPPVMAKGFALLDAAKRAASGNATAEQRVKFLEEGLKNTQLTLDTQAAYLQYKKTGNLQTFRDAIEKLDKFRAAVEGDYISNMSYLAGYEANTWDRGLLTMLKIAGTSLDKGWKLMWDTQKTGESAKWYANDYDTSKWFDINVDAPYEDQLVGKQWEKDHGSDFLGVVWYRVPIMISKPERTKKYRLVFGAVDEACKVWFNGALMLNRPFPYQGDLNSWQTAFEIDITSKVRFDRPNILTVRVENNAGAGGIFKSVYLIESDLTANQSDNLIQNPGFEKEQTSWNQHPGCGTLKFAIDRKEFYGGKACAQIACTKILDKPDAKCRYTAWGRWYQPSIPVKTGTAYRFQIQVKTSEDFSGAIHVWLVDSSGTVEKKILSTQGIWQELSLDSYIPQSNQVGIFLNLINGTGTVWFDEAELIPKVD
jgi:hypothetical protein